MAKKKRKYVKRPSVDWYAVICDIEDENVWMTFFAILHKMTKFGHVPSYNRVAFAALKHHYSTTTLERVRWLGMSISEAERRTI